MCKRPYSVYIDGSIFVLSVRGERTYKDFTVLNLTSAAASTDQFSFIDSSPASKDPNI